MPRCCPKKTKKKKKKKKKEEEEEEERKKENERLEFGLIFALKDAPNFLFSFFNQKSQMFSPDPGTPTFRPAE